LQIQDIKVAIPLSVQSTPIHPRSHRLGHIPVSQSQLSDGPKQCLEEQFFSQFGRP